MTSSNEFLKDIDDPKNEQLYQSLLKSSEYPNLNNEIFLEQISKLIDLSFYLKRKEGSDFAITQLHHFLKREISHLEKATAYYFLANAICDKAGQVKQHDVRLKWKDPEIEKEILYFRLALKYLQLAKENKSPPRHISKKDAYFIKTRYCQICTNLGNLMDHIGRFAEAIEYRNLALSEDPKHGMALGSKGLSYFWYIRFLYDNGHQTIFAHTSYQLFKEALMNELEYGASTTYQNGISYIKSKVDLTYLEKNLDLDSYSLGQTSDEIKYRTWCLQNCLFLNPLNDIGPQSIAARDVLSIPTIVTDFGEGPNCQILYNQLKQEFATARYLYYQGISRKTLHFSDKDVLLFDTGDYPVYSKAAEEIKMSFRMCYSIFDKIAYFLNYYFKLGIKEKDVYFKSLWYIQQGKNNKKKNQPINAEISFRPSLIEKNNLPLLALFWISKDLFEKDDNFKSALDPDAKEWYELRNHLEHKFLRLQHSNDDLSRYSYQIYGEINRSLIHSHELHDFERKTLKLMKTVRAALIYLVLAMQFEEFERKKKQGKNVKSVEIHMEIIPDRQKTNN